MSLPNLYSVHICGHCCGEGVSSGGNPCGKCEAVGLFFTEAAGDFSKPKTISDLRKAAEPWFINYYFCDCNDENWIDEWSAACNDRCPNCGAETEPHYSTQLYPGA